MTDKSPKPITDKSDTGTPGPIPATSDTPRTAKKENNAADSGAGTEKTAVHPESTGNEDPGSELNSPPQRDKIKR